LKARKRAKRGMQVSDLRVVGVEKGSPRGDRENSSVEVVAVAGRRAFTSEYKRRVLDEADRAGPGEIGLILRREGLYSSHLSNWRRWRKGMSRKNRTKNSDGKSAELKRLEKENAKQALRIRKLEAMLDLQKKAAAIWDLADEQSEIDS
jgi:transposase